MFEDVRYAFRLWASRPWQTGLSIAALAIGIGANTGVFSVVNALLLRSLPFREPDRLALVHSYEFIPPHASAKEFHDWRQRSVYLADAALFLVGAQLSGRFLETLIDGAKPIGLGTSAGLLLLLALVASTSIWFATRRITRFDISAILRSE